MNKNQIKLINGDCLEVMDQLIAENITADLVVIDPPYNIGKSKDWDKWDNVEKYVNFMGEVFLKIEKILKKNGSFLFFHNDFLQIVELQNFINKNTSFNFRQFMVWDKFNGGKSGDKGRVERGILNYPKQAEYILFYTMLKGNEPIGNEEIKAYIESERKKINYSLIEINKIAFGATDGKDGMAGNILSCRKKGWSFPTKEKYEKLNKAFPYSFNMKYEDLKDKLEKNTTHTYNCQKKSSVLQFPPEPQNGHITPKPLSLMELLVKTHSNENDLILDCFMGSGTTGVACKNLNRNFIGIELDENYFNIASERINETSKDLGLFNTSIDAAKAYDQYVISNNLEHTKNFD